MPSEARRVNAVPKCWCCRWLWNIWCCCWGLNWGQLQMHYALWPAESSRLKACPIRIREHCRIWWEEWKIGMAQLSQSGTHSIYGHLAPNTPKLGPVNNQPWIAEVFMEYSLYCCSTSYRYILQEWKSSSSVMHLFLSSPGFRVKLQTHDIVYEKESIFFLYFLYSSLL